MCIRYYSPMKILKSLPIKIHIWGGLGSQLHGVALALDLQNRFPKRNVVLYLHTGGISRRDSELQGLFPEVEKIVVDDFKLPTKTKAHGRAKNPRISLSQLVKKSLLLSGLLATSNDADEYISIKPWVYEIRGHYSYRPISRNSADIIIKRITDLANSDERNTRTLAIHLRLGDLLNLESKSFVDIEKLGQELIRILQNHRFETARVYSDSPELALSYLEPYLDGLKIQVSERSALDLLSDSLHFDYFVGTNSKISFWAVFFRFNKLFTCEQSIPAETRQNLLSLEGPEIRLPDCQFY